MANGLDVAETLLLLSWLAWLAWLVFYIRLVLRHGGKKSSNYFLVLFPILLPFDSFWKPGSEMLRIRVLLTALAIILAQVVLINLGVISGS